MSENARTESGRKVGLAYAATNAARLRKLHKTSEFKTALAEGLKLRSMLRIREQVKIEKDRKVEERERKAAERKRRVALFRGSF